METFVQQSSGPRDLLRIRLQSSQDVEAIERRTWTDVLPATTILGCIRQNAQRHPDKPAIQLLDLPDLMVPVRTVTYGELAFSIERYAHLFRAVAGEAKPVVAVMLPMVPESLTALWAAATVGLGVPINPYFDINAISGILNAVGVTSIVTTREYWESKCPDAAAFRATVPSLREIYFVDESGSQSLNDASSRFADVPFTGDDDGHRDAIVMPTGGTTGAPKLVRMSQAGQLLVAWNDGALMGNQEDGVVAHGMPNFHCGGGIVLGLRAIIYGQTLLTLTPAGFRVKETVEQFWRIVERYGVTSVLATPTTALALLSGADTPSEGHTLTDFHGGGSVLPSKLVSGFHDRFGIWLRDNWGMTEMHGTSTGHPGHDREPRQRSAGQRLPFNYVKVLELDENNNFVRECGVGEQGILALSGPGLTQGYFQNPQADAELFIKGVPGGDRWGNTGDLGHIDEDGFVYVTGRAKDLIIRGGHNIDPKGIEDALMGHPAVQEAAAVGRPDPSRGELPIAYVRLIDGKTATGEELMTFCRGRVPDAAARPVEIVIVDQLPTTPVGKIAKPQLRQDALVRSVSALVAEHVGTVEFRVEIDDGGANRIVLIKLPSGSVDSDTLSDLRRALVGFQFETLVIA